MMEQYKLVMFGFGIKLENLSEVRNRLTQIPIQRAKIEGIEQCYLIDLNDGTKYQINFDERKYIIEGLELY